MAGYSFVPFLDIALNRKVVKTYSTKSSLVYELMLVDVFHSRNYQLKLL